MEGSSNTASTSLLEKKEKKVGYHENCPGCRIDRLKEHQIGLPYKHLSYIWLVSLCTALPISSLFPFIYFMIRDFQIARREEDIGYFAGLVGSSFMVGRALTSIFWGVLADRYGRKPIILIGTFSVVIFNTLFGLSTSFWMALSMRFLLGGFNCLLGTIRAKAYFKLYMYFVRAVTILLLNVPQAYAAEVCSQEHRPLALSVVSTSRGLGLIIGPAIGGFFAQPADKYPNVFSKNSLFGRFPYLLPCLLISIYSAGVFIFCWWLPETLHTHNGKVDELEDSCDVLEASPEILNEKEYSVGAKETCSRGSLLTNWPLMSTIIVYCVFSLQEIAYAEIFSLWAVSDRKFGGLSFSSQDVGLVLSISGFGLLVFQLLLYPPIEKVLGPVSVTRLSAAISIPLLASYPYIAMLSGLILHISINCASLLRNALSVSLITGIFILLNNAVPQHQRAAANGISMTAMSVSKAFGPAGAGALFSLAQKRQNTAFLPGDQLVFFILNLIMFIGLVMTFKPFLAQPKYEQN